MSRVNSIFYKRVTYILLFFIAIFLNAQNKPGNTSLDVELWLKADDLSLTDNADVMAWADRSTFSRNFNQYNTNNSPAPLFKLSGMNYNPYLDFTSVSGNSRKLVGPQSIINNAKEYYIFYVSQSLKTSGYGTILQFQPTTYNPAVGWNAKAPWFNDGVNRITLYTKSYAINAVFFPNAANSTTVKNNIYINGELSVYNGSILTSGTGLMNIGGGNLTNGNPFIGYLSEIIVLSNTKPTLTPGVAILSEINKVNSYLSIKYGISLDPTSQPIYYNSSGDEIWNSTTDNEYSNFVFGIGRDDASGLLQKQATNYENNDFTIYLGPTLASSNKTNTSTFSTDKSYLILGSNNALGTSTYTNTSFTNNLTLTSPIYQRYNRTLKVRKSGNVGSISLKLTNDIQNSSYIIVSNSNSFSANTTRIYPIINGVASNMELNNNDYISFISNIKAPGGTNYTTELWLKADDLNLTENANVTTWTDQSIYNRNFSQYLTNNVPVYKSLAMNYNPALTFGSAANTKLVGPVNITDPTKEYYVYSVSYNRSTSWAIMLAFNQERNNSYGWSSTSTTPWVYIAGNRSPTQGIGKPYNISAVFAPNRTANTNPLITSYQYINGIENNLGNAIQFSTSTTNRMSIGTEDLGTDYPFVGDISELIVLSAPKGSGAPNRFDIQKVNSYLSLKYGLSLNSTSQPIYYNSSGEEIWNSSSAGYTEYNNNVFGIGRDDLTGFYQKQATNYESNSFTLFLGPQLTATNKANTSTIANDKNFVIVGANGANGNIDYVKADGTQYSNGTLNSTNGIKKRYARTLRVKKTGTSITQVNLKLNEQFLLAPYVVVSNNTDFSETNSYTKIYPVVNGFANNIELNDGDYIGFIAANLSPGGTNLETEMWLRADYIFSENNNNITNWYDTSNYGINVSQNSTDSPIFINNGLNYNPALKFSSSTYLTGNYFVQSGKSYYVFYVANNTTNSAAYNTVFSFVGNNNLWSTGLISNRNWLIASENVFSTLTSSNYMVSTAYFPNTTSSIAQILNNGQSFSGTSRNNTMPTTGTTVIGAQQTNNTLPFVGDISEVIVVSAPVATSFNDNIIQIQKVNSYLALKYGITLNPSSQANYYSSSSGQGTIIWDGIANSNYSNDIFGIGRDDLTGFYQKQATSANQNSVTLYLDELKESNTMNNGSISTDRNFIILGSNKADDVIDYRPGTTSYANSNSNELIYQRYRRTLKASNITNYQPSNLNIKLDNELYSSSYVIISNSESFTPASTRIYPVNNGVANNVSIQHNDFISFIPKNNTPGALSGLRREIWLVADDINNSELDNNITDDITNSYDITTWTNRADYSNNFSNPSITPYYPMYNKSAMNFHSSASFYVADSLTDGDVGISLSIDQNRARKLISKKNFITDNTRSYFTIYISRLDEEARSNNIDKAVFSLNRYDNFGWTANTNSHPWIRVANSASTNAFPAASGETRTYGITINMVPNVSTTSSRYLSLNGIRNTAIEGTTVMNTANTYKSVIANEYYDTNNAGTYRTNNFFGDVLEILVLSKPGTNQSLSSEELERINTYYALKYGITLNKNGQKKYVTSSNNTETVNNSIVFYDIEAEGYAEYNKDIFGLVRDDKSGLYQKQAVSTDNGLLTIYQGDLAESNEENKSNGLLDLQAVVLGASGDAQILNSYQKIAGEASGVFSNYTLQAITDPITGIIQREKTSNIFNYKYRAKVTGANYIDVNMAPGLGQFVVISQDSSFPNASTRIYKITGGNVKNVRINNGDYIGFAFYMEAPGGVSDRLRMWLNASESQTITTNSADEILTWADYSGFGTTYRRRPQNNSSAVYQKASESTNFHPTAYFRKWQDYLITDRSAMFNVSPPYSTVYAVVNHNFATSRSYFIGFGAQTAVTNARRPSFGVYRAASNEFGDGRGRIGSTNLTNSTQNLFNTGATTIAGFSWKLRDSIKFDFDANLERVRHTDSNSLMNGPGMLGLASSSTSYYLQGTMPEVIAYEKDLTSTERNKINSYLGLKYAITLFSNRMSTPRVNFNYVFSDGTSVWDGTVTPFNSYHNNVASVLRDDDSKLYNKQAKSTDIGDVIHMGIGESLGIDGELGLITENKSALTWGNNGIAFSTYNFGDDSSICGTMDSRIGGRIWLAHPTTNFNQEVIVRAAQGGTFPYNGPGWQVYMLVADSPEKLAINGSNINNNWDQIIPMEFIDGGHQLNYKFTEDTYFTFGAKRTGSCESCDFIGEKTLEFTRATWPNAGFKGPRDFNLNNEFHVKVTVEDPNNQLTNRYPRYSSRKSLRERRKGVQEITTTIEFTNNNGEPESAATYFDLLDIDRAGYKRDDVQVIGYCGGSPVYPTIGYTYRRPERSTYLINTDGRSVGKAPGQRYSGNVGYTNARGIAYVEFENPVDKIEIIYKTITSRQTNNTQEIGIGSMNFYCVAPPPPPNEDGLIFTKQATPNALLCEAIDYTFRVINTNCDTKKFNFTDQLPEDMEWIESEFSVFDPTMILDTINGNVLYDSIRVNKTTRTLNVYGLIAPGGGTTLTFRGKALFTEDAEEGDYENQGTISYESITGPAILTSTDRLTGNPLSITKAISSGTNRPKLIETKLDISKDCFSINKEITATLLINNPNEFAINDMVLDIGYDSESVTYLNHTITGFNIAAGNVIIDQETEGGVTTYGGFITFDGFTIPSGSSKVTITFKTRSTINEFPFINADGDPVDINFSYELISENEDICLSNTTLLTNGDVDIPFCSFCTQQPTANGTPSASNSGISTFKNKFTNWPTDVPNGFLVLESSKKGMVITRTKESLISNPQKGMIIYDTTKNCITIFNGNEWKCLERACNE